MIWLKDDGNYDYQSGDDLNDEHMFGSYRKPDEERADSSGDDLVFETSSGSRVTIYNCNDAKAKVALYYPASQYHEELDVVPFKGDLIEELERRGFDRTPS